MKNYFIVSLTLALLATQISCKKDNDSIGLSSGNGTLHSASIDTFQLITYSTTSQNTPSNSGTSVFIGGYRSDELGELFAQSFTSIAPTDLSFRIPEGGVTVSSVSLSINITESYGAPYSQSFKVNKTTSEVAKDFAYTTNDSLQLAGDNLGTFILSSNDTGSVSISLDNSFGAEIMNTGDVIFTTSEMFTDVFMGLAITPTSSPGKNEGSIYAIDADEIILTVNFTEDVSGDAGSVSFAPIANSRSFYHTSAAFNSSEVQTQFSNLDLGNENFFLQGLGGVKADLRLPSLLTWFTAGKFLINKAIVTIPVTASAEASFLPPTSLTIHKASDSSSEGVQAVYDADNNQYVFDIEPLLSDKLLNNEKAELELSVLNSFAHPEQVKLNGSKNASAPASVIIHYTEY